EAAASTAASSTTASVSTASTAATTTVAAATTAAAATAALFAGTGFIDGEGPAIVLLSVEGLDGSLGFVVVRHFDEAKALGPAGVAIVDDLGRGDLAVLAEQLLEFRAIDLVAQVPDIQFLTHWNLLKKW